MLALMAEGRSNSAIADRLSVTLKTVESHIANIFSKLGLHGAQDDHRRVLAVLAALKPTDASELGTARRAEAITAGMPTPSYAAPQTARPATAATAARIRATRSRWPTAYCGSPPPHRCTWVSTGRGLQAGDRPRGRPATPRRARRRWPGAAGLLAVPAERGAEVGEAGSAPGVAGPSAHLAKENVLRLDRPALDRRHQEAGGRQVRAQRPRPPRANANVTIATDADSMVASSAAAAARRRRAAARSARPASRGPPRRPRSARARWRIRRRARSPWSVRRSSRTVRRVRTSTRSASASASRPTPPGIPANTGTSDDRQLGVEQASQRSAAVDQLRHGGPRREQVGVAGVDATEQRLDQPVDDLVAEPARDQVADRDVLVERYAGLLVSGPGQPGLREHALEPRSSSRSSGTPISERGSGRSSPRVHTCAEVVAGWTTSRPSSRARSTPSGRRLSIDSAPTSTVTPPTSARRSLPPTSGAALQHQHLDARPRARSYAAVSPAIPPPTTTTLRTGHSLSDGRRRPSTGCDDGARGLGPLAEATGRPRLELTRPPRSGWRGVEEITGRATASHSAYDAGSSCRESRT